MFRDRADAGRKLAERLIHYKDRRPVILALPRGGVPVAAEIAAALDTPLDVLLVRKIGMPFQRELALGAVLDGDHPEIVIDERLKQMLEFPDEYVRQESARQLQEIERRRVLYLEGRQPVPVEGRTVIVVDDGLATGSTMRAALLGLRRRHPVAIVLAVPVAPPDTVAALRPEVTDLICLMAPPDFEGVGQFYRDFRQIEDSEVTALLRKQSAGAADEAGRPPRWGS